MKSADENLLCQRLKAILTCYPIWSGNLGRSGPELRDQLVKTVASLDPATASPEAKAVESEICSLCRAIDERFPTPMVSHYLASTREAIARWDNRYPRHERDMRPGLAPLNNPSPGAAQTPLRRGLAV